MFRIHDKDAKPDDLAIDDRFTEDGAKALVARLKEQGREAYYEPFTPRCSWGSAYNSTHCQADAVRFDPRWDCYTALCEDHYREALALWPNRMMLGLAEMIQTEHDGTKAPMQDDLCSYWTQRKTEL